MTDMPFLIREGVLGITRTIRESGHKCCNFAMVIPARIEMMTFPRIDFCMAASERISGACCGLQPNRMKFEDATERALSIEPRVIVTSGNSEESFLRVASRLTHAMNELGAADGRSSSSLRASRIPERMAWPMVPHARAQRVGPWDVPLEDMVRIQGTGGKEEDVCVGSEYKIILNSTTSW